MAYGICRIKKLKAGSVNGSARHTNREQEVLNADPEKQHLRILGEPDRPNIPDLESIVRERIGEQMIRKNAVLAVEFLLTASPEYFRPDSPERAGHYEPERLADFQHQACKWLTDNYGDRIVRAELHLDESTPHIHAYMVPLDEKGKLNCRGLLGGSRHSLSKLQDNFATAMKPLGLERGIRGSKARHTEVKKYYTAVTQSPDITLDTQTIHHQLADRQLAIKKKQELEKTALTLLKDLEQKNKQIQDLERQASESKNEAVNWKNKYKDLADKVRDTPLDLVATQLCLEPDPSDKYKWDSLENTISITGSKFYDWQQMKGGGGAIDLVMHVNQCDFKQSVAWLNERLGESAMLEAASYHAKVIAETEPVYQFTPPAQDVEKWQQVKTYLKSQRMLPSSMIDNLHDLGLVYADDRENAVFIRRTLPEQVVTGASLRGTTGTNNNFKGLARGSKRDDGWFYFARGGQSGEPIQRVVLTKSPIDAMSKAILERSESSLTLYLSVDRGGNVPLEFLLNLRERSVIVALGNDATSEAMAQKIMEQLQDQTVRSQSKANDWNQDLINFWIKEEQQAKLYEQQEQQPRRGLRL